MSTAAHGSAKSSDQRGQQPRKRTDYESDAIASTPHDTRAGSSLPVARPIVGRDPDGIHEAGIRSTKAARTFRARSVGTGSSSIPVEIEMSSSRSGSMEEEDGESAPAGPSSLMPPPIPGHRSRLSSRDGSPMKIGGTLSFEGGDSESDVGSTSGAGNSILHPPRLAGPAASPSYRRISFFPTVDELSLIHI